MCVVLLYYQKWKIGVNIVSCGHCVDDEVQRPGCSRHTLLVSRHHKMVSTNVPGSSFLVGRGGHCGDSVAHGLGQLDPHLSQATNTNDANTETTLPSTKLGERGEHSDASTEHRSSTGQGISGGHLDHKPGA